MATNRFILKLSVIIILLTNLSNYGFSQSKVILDSLQELYNQSKRDTTKILLLAEIAGEQAYIDSALKLSNQGLDWAKKINYPKGILRNSIQIALINWAKNIDTTDIEGKFNTLLIESNRIDDIRSELNCKIAIAKLYRNSNRDISKVVKILNESLTLSLAKDEIFAPVIINLLVNFEMYNPNFSVDDNLYKAITICSKYNNHQSNKYLAQIYYTYAMYYYYNLVNYQKSVEFCLKQKNINEVLLDSISINYNNFWLSVLYMKTQDYENSLKYGIKYVQSIKDTLSDEYFYNQYYIGWLQYLVKDYNSALHYTNKALDYYNTKQDEYLFKNCLTNIGLIYLKLSNYDEALNHANLSEKKIKEGIESYNDLTDANLFVIASYYNHIGKIKLSNEFAYKAKEICTYSELELLSDIYFLLYKNHKCLNDLPKALNFLEKQIQFQDSVDEINRKSHVNFLVSESEEKKKNTEILLAAKEKKIAQEKSRVQRLYSLLLGSGLIFVLLFLIVSIRSYRLQKRSNRLLQIQKEQIAERNEELNQLNEEISAQRDNISEQKSIVERQKKDITDSIVYASWIQTSLLPPQEILTNSFPEHFILFKPKDIVSGDFYWLKQINNYIYIVAADCTGHGVPGAFMSMLGISLLNDIVGKRDINPPSEILNELRKRIKKTLHQTAPDSSSKDGMDIALCMYDFETKSLQYSGAFNSLIILKSNKELIEVKADRMPVGSHPKDDMNFTNHQIELEEGDTIYIYSDGYVSQFGGDKNEKYKMSWLKELLIRVNDKSLEEQKTVLDRTLIEWQGTQEQVDDILVIGIKV